MRVGMECFLREVFVKGSNSPVTRWSGPVMRCLAVFMGINHPSAVSMYIVKLERACVWGVVCFECDWKEVALKEACEDLWSVEAYSRAANSP